MASIDDWILLKSDSFLGGDVIERPDYLGELKRQYTNYTGIDPDGFDYEDYIEGGLQRWTDKTGIPAIHGQAIDDAYFGQYATKQMLDKFGYQAPTYSQSEAAALDLRTSSQYQNYVKSTKASNVAGQKATADKIRDEWNATGGSTSATEAFQNKYGFILAGSGNPETDAEIAQAAGYKTTTPDSWQSYYGDKYGTKFSESRIDQALTGKYGEIQSGEQLGEGWKDLYQTYDRWRQEDQMWEAEMLGLQGQLFPQAMAQQRAQMAKGGMATGSGQWERNLSNIEARKVNIEDEAIERETALKGTSVYKSLKDKWDEMKKSPEMRGKTVTETTSRVVNKYVEATNKYVGAKYGRDSETGEQILISPGYWQNTPSHYEQVAEPYEYERTIGTETGKLLYGTGDEQAVAPTFYEFYESQVGGATNVENPYAQQGASNQPESEDERQARISASGAAME